MPAELCELTVHIDTGRWNEAVLDAVDLLVPDGRSTVLLGESGCGKSMAAAALTGSLPYSARITGQARVDGEPVHGQHQWRRLRGGTVGLLLQDGVTAFRAEDTVGAQLRELEDWYRRWSFDRACTAARYPTELTDLRPHSSVSPRSAGSAPSST